MTQEHSAIVTLYGHPNVGKSSLLNTLMAQKVAAVSPKPQTTVHALRAILSIEHYQFIFMDTPGLLAPRSMKGKSQGNRITSRELLESDINLLVVDAKQWQKTQKAIPHAVETSASKEIVILNKIDLIPTNEHAALIEQAKAHFPESWIIPTSVKTMRNIDLLLATLKALCPEKAWRTISEMAKNEQWHKDIIEAVREQMLRSLDLELPYVTRIHLVSFREEKKGFFVQVNLQVDRVSRKKMLIGSHGQMIKKIGMGARMDLCRRWQKPVHLTTQVEVVDSS